MWHNTSHSATPPCMLITLSFTTKKKISTGSTQLQSATSQMTRFFAPLLLLSYCFHLLTFCFIDFCSALHHFQIPLCQHICFWLATVPLANQCTPTEKFLVDAAKKLTWKGLALNVSSCILSQIHQYLERNYIVQILIFKNWLLLILFTSSSNHFGPHQEDFHFHSMWYEFRKRK